MTATEAREITAANTPGARESEQPPLSAKPPRIEAVARAVNDIKAEAATQAAMGSASATVGMKPSFMRRMTGAQIDAILDEFRSDGYAIEVLTVEFCGGHASGGFKLSW